MNKNEAFTRGDGHEIRRPDHAAKEKAIACKTPEELIELAKEEGIELTEAQLEGIAGGGWKHPSCGDDTAWTYAC